jgi:AcrR family transcriptional regulator
MIEHMFSIWYMRSTSDLTARAVIRDQALRLFGERGPDAVSIRAIAEAAGVSPALVVHHFGSKQGLRDAVDAHVAEVFDALFAASASQDPAELFAVDPGPSLAELMRRHLPPDSPVPAYLRHLLLSGQRIGRELFARWHAASQALLAALAGQGVARPSTDPPVRAAFLLVNDLAVLLLREQLTAVLGADPLTPDGMRRWAADVLDVYHHGVFHPREDQ